MSAHTVNTGTRTIGDTLAEATALHQRGDHAGAEAVYRGLLQRHPGSADARFRLGLLLAQVGRLYEAVEMFGSALQIAPGFAPLWSEQAAAQLRLGWFDASLESYDRLLALRPDDVGAFNNRGAALLRLARPAEALASFDAALAVRPDLAEAMCNRGNALLALGRVAEALESYDRTLALNPALAQAATSRADALERLDRPAEALASYDQAIAAVPGLVQAHYNRANLLQTLERHDEAIAGFDAVLALLPTHAGAACNRATSLRAVGRLDEALAGYAQAIFLDPTMTAALINHASLLAMLGHHQKALEDFARAKAISPDNANTHYNEALCRLAMGDFKEGWREHEWRWQTDALRPGERHFPQPLWLGETPLTGRTILLHGEQGFGDVLQFCRFAPLVAALGDVGNATLEDTGSGPRVGQTDGPGDGPGDDRAQVAPAVNVVLEVPAAMERLIRTMPGPQRVVAQNEPPPEFDVHCPLLSLPLALGTTLETIPAAVPYLAADPDQARVWRIRLAAEAGLHVGLVWSGNPRPADRALAAIDRRRSVPLARLAPLAAVAGVTFVSLQKGHRTEEARTPPPGMLLRDWTDELWDFADTAALIDGLDLVIGVDTSVVHLAGALGKPVWVLNRYDACWRWLHGRTDSPWYPTMRLFHQARFGDWDGVIAEMVDALRERVG